MESFIEFIRSAMSPATYGFDSGAFVIFVGVLTAAVYKIKEIVPFIVRAFSRVVYAEVHVEFTSSVITSLSCWMRDNYKYSLLPVKSFSTAFDHLATYYGDRYTHTYNALTPNSENLWLKIPGWPLVNVITLEKDLKDLPNNGSVCVNNSNDVIASYKIRMFIWNRAKLIKLVQENIIPYYDTKFKGVLFSRDYSKADWSRRAKLNTRCWNTVFLPDELKVKLSEDVNNFFSEETCKFYNNAGIPHHRGMLLYGIPGTGKTTLVRALCTKLNKNLYTINLSNVFSANDLESAIEEVEANSIILMEDIDCVSGVSVDSRGVKTASKRDDQDKDKPSVISLSSLLNIIDGVNTREGVFFIFTTNHFEKLDPAFIRVGRCDIKEEIPAIGPELQWEMVCYAFGEVKPMPDWFRVRGCVPACEIQGHALSGFLQNNENGFNLCVESLKRSTPVHAKLTIAN